MVTALAVTRVTAPLPAVQQPVEERAEEQQQVRQGAKDVSGVLGQEEEGSNGEKA
jgi:hypothetical protein